MIEPWPRLAVGELVRNGEANLQTGPFGTQLSASEYVPTGIPVINVRNVGFGDVRDGDLEFVTEAKAEQLHHHILRKGDIVFGRKGAVERHALIDEGQHGWVQGSDCLRLRLQSKRFNVRFVSFYLRTQAHQDWMQALCAFGATMSSLNQGIVNRIQLPCPPLSVQKHIAAILAAYDDLIANNQRRIALLESIAEDIYREWFVRMRCPIDTAANASTRRLLPFDRLCELKRGFDLPEGEMQAGTVPVIASTSIKGFHNVAKVKPPVITTGRSGSLGTVLYVREPAWPLNTSLWVKDFKGNSPNFVYFTLRGLHLENFNAGAGVPTLNRNHLKSIKVRIPTEASQSRFDEVVEPLLSQAHTLRATNTKLMNMRDALLPRLISGKLRVDHLDIHYPPSMQADQDAAAGL